MDLFSHLFSFKGPSYFKHKSVVCLCVAGGWRHWYFVTGYNLGKQFYYNHTFKKQLMFHSHFGREYPLLRIYMLPGISKAI